MRRLLFPVLAFTLALVPAVASAQTSARKRAQGPPPVPLTPKAAQVLDTLDSLNVLSLERWRFEVTDMPHAEGAIFDDSKWQQAPEQAELSKRGFTLAGDAVWFRTTLTVPTLLHGYDLTGARVWFQFHVDANGPVPMIVYFNGRRVAMGEDLEPIVLEDNLHPGDRVVIAVKALHTVDKKIFTGADATIDFAEGRPNPLGFATEARCAQVLLPSVAPTDTEAPPALNAAVEKVSLDALSKGDQKAFDASLWDAQAALAQLRPVMSSAFVRITGNAHIDAAWLWPWTETVDVARRTFATALQLMQEYPGYTFSQSAAAYSEWIEEKYPDEFKQIQEEVKAHRWELVGGMWVEPDLNMPGGESLVRQLLVGKRYFQQKFGVDVRVGWNPDSFGYNWQLPQIYKKSGVDYFVTQKMWWNDTNPLPLKLFWWQGPDGSRVLAYFPHDYVNEIEPLKIARDFAAARVLNPGTDEMMHLYGVGDHGGGPTRAMLDAANSWMYPAVGPDNKPAPPRAPVLSYSISQTFFSDVEKKLDTAHSPVWNYATLAAGNTTLPTPPTGEFALPVWNDELYLEYHRGVFTTQAAHKANMRSSEDWLLDAEKWSTIAWLGGSSYPENKLNEAWKKVLFNQFHDLAAGSGIAVIYKDAQRDYDVVHWTASDATGHAQRSIDSVVDTRIPASLHGEHAVPIIVWNPLPWTRSDTVHVSIQTLNGPSAALVDATGKPIPSTYGKPSPGSANVDTSFFATDVPALGYKVFYGLYTTQPDPHGLGAWGLQHLPSSLANNHFDFVKETGTMANSFVSVTVDPKSGCITHLINKKSGFDAIAPGGCGNQLQTFKDTPKDYDAWNIDPGTLDHYEALGNPDSVEYTVCNLFLAAIVKQHFGHSTITQTITVTDDSPVVTVTNDVEWHETHVLLKAAFPLAATNSYATYEIPYGAIQRPTTRNNSFEQARFEVPALRWADLGDGKNGFSLINNSKYGYDCAGNVLRLSLLRSPTWPDPDADRGHQHFEYALYPHAGSWQEAETVRRGYEFNDRLHAQQVFEHDGSLPAERSFGSVSPANVILSAMKKTEDGNGVILRIYESAGQKTTATVTLPTDGSHIAPGAVTVVNLMEKPDGDKTLPVKDGKVTVELGPWEILTLRVDAPKRGDEFWMQSKK
jgi:alpha-mannosidase